MKNHIFIMILLFILSVFFGYKLSAASGFLSLPLYPEEGSLYPSINNGWKYDCEALHYAIDYDTYLRQPIVAACDGRGISTTSLTDAGRGAYGRFILIECNEIDPISGKHYMVINAHLDSAAEWIEERNNSDTNYEEWTPIKRGKVIGFSGQSGTRWVHLHFEVFTGDYSEKKPNRKDPYDIYKTAEECGGSRKLDTYPPHGSMGQSHLWTDDPPPFPAPIGFFKNYVWNDNSSSHIVDAHDRNGGEARIGQPHDDNEAGFFVHDWNRGNEIEPKFCLNHSSLCLQNFSGGTYGENGIFFNPVHREAYLVRTGFWDYYRHPDDGGQDGATKLGYPYYDETGMTCVNGQTVGFQQFQYGALFWREGAQEATYIQACILDPCLIYASKSVVHQKVSQVTTGEECPGDLPQCFDMDGDRYGEGPGCLGPDCDDNITPM